ncbi:MAG: high-affinity branched-chain amino acid ABC transporter permease LivH [Cardiobacteriaceae bacterium]|nr:high-affinity branched-chain amino acid ABC transporter permease LivH [Cardiobacteriaceae bacterium]
MQELTQQIINGLTLGSIYALIAIGYTMVYGIIGLINFAHGEIYMLGAFSGIVAVISLQSIGITFLPLLLALVFLFAILTTSGYGFLVEKLAYKPLRRSPRLVPLISAIGMSIFLQNYVAIGQSAKNISLQPVISTRWDFFSQTPYAFTLSALQIIIFVVTLASMIALHLFIKHSRTGKACRACAEDLGMAQLLGIDTNKIISFTFMIGASLAAVAGVLIALYYGTVHPNIGFMAGMKAFTAAVLGGIGSIPGAMLGGFLLGLSENFAGAYFASEYKDVISFSLLILILLVRPSGILGKPAVEKV